MDKKTAEPYPRGQGIDEITAAHVPQRAGNGQENCRAYPRGQGIDETTAEHIPEGQGIDQLARRTECGRQGSRDVYKNAREKSRGERESGRESRTDIAVI